MDQNQKLESNLEVIEFKWSKNRAINRIEHFFKFDKFKTTIKKEILGGLTTFLAMAYILSLLPAKLGGLDSITADHARMGVFGIFLATAIIAFLSTFLMGLFANIPVALAPGLGILAMFITTVGSRASNQTILGYEGTLIATFISAIFFTIFSVTPVRGMIIRAMPHSLNVAIGVGIGLFLAYLGIADMGWVEINNGVPVASISRLADNYPGILLGTGTLGLILYLNHKKVPGAVLISLIAALIIALLIANLGPNFSVSKGTGAFASANFQENGGWSYQFADFPLNIKNTWSEFTNPLIWKNPTFYVSIFLFIFLNFFDATSSLNTCVLAVNKKTQLPHPVSKKAMMIDSTSSIVASTIGVSPVSSFLESTAGIEQGARTGFASIITALGFLLAIAFFPIFKAIPSCATGAAITFIGIMIFKDINQIEWKRPEFLITSLFILLFMVITYSVVNGIIIGMMVYPLVMVGMGKYKEVHPAFYVLFVLFVLYFVAYGFMQVS